VISTIKKHLDLIGLSALIGYAGFLIFAALDDLMGWEILFDYF
jgi:hypothetical protein